MNEPYLTIEPQKPYFIESDCWRQASKPDSNDYVIFEWKQLARFYFYQFYFRHKFDVTYFAKTSAVKFLINGQEVMLQRAANITIPANTPYTFRGVEHVMNELFCMAPVAAKESWEAAARATLEAEKTGLPHHRLS
jgi:hypothetical protein